ncbi:MAG: tRNA (adenosine(37)-N6)-threonylcarbamoyltransferase complex ATPase subunit type 1 TsaE [Spirochaetes bacterium]|jgi:tRNA threonylcarbamoyladenosine biosynthesis protein TsaE|nr:tRNA (adenosine(37)-N6)-threonylcarbamoyltransferase complex ATPase subunit type 1 TsaE [Spirochaetota bacterium]
MSIEASTPAILHCASSEETAAAGERLAARLGPGSVVLLIGPLGAGKTTLAKGIGLGLGVSEQIISPTYTIVSEYRGRLPLHHVDLYRVEGREQIENLGLDDFLWGEGVSLVEWGEKIEGQIDLPHLRVTLRIAAGGGRDIAVEERTGGSRRP